MITVTNWVSRPGPDLKHSQAQIWGTSVDRDAVGISELDLIIQDLSTGKKMLLVFAGDDLDLLKEVLCG